MILYISVAIALVAWLGYTILEARERKQIKRRLEELENAGNRKDDQPAVQE